MALAQSGGCTLTPVAEAAWTFKSCQVLRRGDITGGLQWEMQQRVFRPAREGSGDLVLRVSVVTERGVPVAWTEPGDGDFTRPERFATDGRILLRLPETPRIPGGQTRDEIWMHPLGVSRWLRLDAQSWRTEAASRLRPDESLDTRHQIDLRPLRATGRIARAGDPPCCPGGGSYTAWLELADDRLLLTGFTRR